MSQDRIFLEDEGDAWFVRNSGDLAAASSDDPVLSVLAEVTVPPCGALLDIGGANGRVSAGFLRDHPGWHADVLEPSPAAIEAGCNAFPGITFKRGTVSDAPSLGVYGLVVVSFVLSWVDRAVLAKAISSVDAALKDAGLLVIADFDPASPRANPYAHRAGLWTYKQDYAACFTSLGTYRVLTRHRFVHGSSADTEDPFDRRCAVWLLRKDLEGGYARR